MIAGDGAGSPPPEMGNAVPDSLLAALRAQHARRRQLLTDGARHVGWKIGAGIAEIDEVTGGNPAIGYLTSASVFEHGAALDAVSGRELRVETELLIEVAGNGAGARGVVGVALELVDVARPPCGMKEIVEANVFHRAAVLGRPRSGGLPAAACARLSIDGELREIAPVTTNVPVTIAHVAGLLAAIGERLHAGDLILAGSLTHMPLPAGGVITAEIDGVGGVQATVNAGAKGVRANP